MVWFCIAVWKQNICSDFSLHFSSTAVCVFLTSVYIGDIWLGAQEPDMLITHVKLICSSTDDGLNDGDLETHKQGEKTIMSLCKPLYLATSGH